MPEVVTKYPQALIKELKDAGGKCGEGLTPKILTSCPSDFFCSLPTGEVCVYDLGAINTMTQVSHAEWQGSITGIPAITSVSNLILLIIIFGIGLVVGTFLQKR